MSNRPVSVLASALAVLAATVAACGGGGGGGGSTPTPVETPPPGAAATLVINSSGVIEPREVTIPVGGRVNVTNNHNTFHEMQSDPHPSHTDCPAINALGVIPPGATRQTSALNTPLRCGIHDHGRETDRNLMATIIVQ